MQRVTRCRLRRSDSKKLDALLKEAREEIFEKKEQLDKQPRKSGLTTESNQLGQLKEERLRNESLHMQAADMFKAMEALRDVNEVVRAENLELSYEIQNVANDLEKTRRKVSCLASGGVHALWQCCCLCF